ncbi:hypothetical protein NKDENANG_03091 [Candidatus Entotheonellaceae bacterium PAL068K]
MTKLSDKSWYTVASTYLHLADEDNDCEARHRRTLFWRLSTVLTAMLMIFGCESDSNSNNGNDAEETLEGTMGTATTTATGTGNATATDTATATNPFTVDGTNTATGM